MNGWNNPVTRAESAYENIQEIRDKLADTILLCIAFLGAPLIFISFLRYLEVGGKLLLVIHFILYLFSVSAALYRKKTPLRVKAIFVIVCAFLMAVSSIAKWGIIGSGVSYFIFCSVLVSIFYGAKPGIAVTIFNLVIMFFAAILFNAGYLQFGFDINKFSTALPTWISTTSVYGAYTLVLVSCLSRLYNSMSITIQTLASRTSELNTAKEQMEMEIKIRKQAEMSLQESEERFRVVLENLPVGVFVHDLQGTNLIVNDEACKSTGYSREELLSKAIEETETDSFNMENAKKTWRQLVETGESITFESVTHRKDGSVYDKEVHLKSATLQGRPVILAIVFNITERKQAEIALRESEERFRTVLENLPCGVSVHDLEGRMLIVNEETCRERGYSKEELLNLTVMDTAGPGLESRDDVKDLWKRIELGTSYNFEVPSQRKDGSLYDSEVSLSKIMLDGREVILSLVFDISERKKSEEALKQNEMYLRTLVSTIPDLIWLKDTDGKYLYCNSRFEDFFGANRKQIVGKTDYDFVDKKLADFFRENDQEAIEKGGQSKNEETIIFANDGHSEILETIKTPMHSDDGRILGVLGIGRDITERKRIENTLERRLELERLISEISSGFIGINHNDLNEYMDEALASIGKQAGADRAYLFLVNTDGLTINNTNEWCSDNTTSQIEYLKDISLENELPWFAEQIKKMDIVHIPDVENLPDSAQLDKDHFKSQRIKSLIVLGMRQGENLIGFMGFDNVHSRKTWSESEIVILRIIGEAFTSAIQRRQYEREQEKLQVQLTTAVELAHLGAWELDVENSLFTFNDQFYKIYHTNAEEMGGYTMPHDEYVRRFIHPDDMAIVGRSERIGDAPDASDPERVEHKMFYADGTTGYVMSQMFLVRNSKGVPVKVYGVNQDITEWKLAEKKLRESEEKLARSKKMESLGLLAGGVAHDLNNVLSGIVSYPELLLLDLPADSKLRKPIETIQESGNRAVAIVQDLLTIARGAATTKEPLNLNMIINEYLVSPEFYNLKNNNPLVRVKTDLDHDLFKFRGSFIHIKKVIMNLVSNALEAIENQGKVVISTNNRYVDMPLSKYEDVNTGEYVVLTVLDDGPGISPDNLDRIFEPFFTKKVMGISGTGLGLTVVWNTVQDHSGYIDVKSDKNGTKFELYFPITREESAEKALSASLDEFKGNGELILVVDDVASQREISCRMLDSLGYRYVAVPGGKEAIKYVKNNKVDLILLDMIMTPGIGGRETYEQIVKIHPEQKAVIISGFTENEDVVAIQKLGAGGYIRKPFSLEILGKSIKEELKK